jgi:predicted nucleotidyltransferase
MTDPILQRDSRLADIVSRLVDTFHPERIYLFGSKARGEDGKDSDYDLMVLLNDDAAAAKVRWGRKAYQALRGTGVAADVLVWSLRTFESRLHVSTSLPATIKKEGILLYAA